MDTTTDLLVILLYLSALYSVLGLLAAAAEAIAARRSWRGLPLVQRRPRRARPRRRTDRDLPGALRRPVCRPRHWPPLAARSYAVSAAKTAGSRSGSFST